MVYTTFAFANSSEFTGLEWPQHASVVSPNKISLKANQFTSLAPTAPTGGSIGVAITEYPAIPSFISGNDSMSSFGSDLIAIKFSEGVSLAQGTIDIAFRVGLTSATSRTLAKQIPASALPIEGTSKIDHLKLKVTAAGRAVLTFMVTPNEGPSTQPVRRSLLESSVPVSIACVQWLPSTRAWESDGCRSEFSSEDTVVCHCAEGTMFTTQIVIAELEVIGDPPSPASHSSSTRTNTIYGKA